ncbi:MAG: phosphoribosylamine--glycine ligase [Candidatus Endonucleobacter bathymodioli]|uniref:Phosphoribosylamine--glycine ligase n=1 Tax=Candidatus Endonucleibacter bathymodioli TaxID=539814 RepID=A0AA90NLW0_9GAMM|nr:phosphoribosylamine--glycine ligase [Candidatus Endonucleobacter bathymodioli]
MKVLIIGNGGREHALAWKVAQDQQVEQVFVAPGNAGTALTEKVTNIPIGVLDIQGLANFAQDEHIALTIVGPEAPLVAGLVDHFEELGLTAFGPSKAAAQLEGSKTFSKDFLTRHNIPTAAYQSFTDIHKAKDYIREQGTPIVVKADGLAAGKGVILAKTEDQAFSAIDSMLAGNAFKEAGHKVIIEKFLQGEEVSFIVMVDGNHVLPMATSQDHKARDNGDKGPNTGGMGAYSPAPAVTQAIYDRIMTEVIYPTVHGMAKEGIPYKGFLYAGLMIDDKETPWVLEYNCRFGDPEAQPILMRLKSNLTELCFKGAHGLLADTKIQWDKRVALSVVMAAGGYPERYRTGDPIYGIDTNLPDTQIFHAGTELKNKHVVTNGGRILSVTALADTVSIAQQKAYQSIKNIKWNNAYYRTDIGYRAIERENN